MTARQTGLWVTFKGLRLGALSWKENLVIAVTSVAPAYSLAATLVVLVTVADVKTPALFIVGFIPAVLTAFAFRELAKETPDCGSTFTWATRAFGPWAGWIGGWALIVASTAAVGNAAQIAAVYLLKACDLKVLCGFDVDADRSGRHNGRGRCRARSVASAGPCVRRAVPNCSMAAGR